MSDPRTRGNLATSTRADSLFRCVRCTISALLCPLVLWMGPPPCPAAGTLPTHAEPGVPGAIVSSVESVGMTVSDMDRSLDFYSHILAFVKISDVEVTGIDYEH